MNNDSAAVEVRLKDTVTIRHTGNSHTKPEHTSVGVPSPGIPIGASAAEEANLEQALVASTPPAVYMPKIGGIDTLQLVDVNVELSSVPFNNSSPETTGVEVREQGVRRVTETVRGGTYRVGPVVYCGGQCDPEVQRCCVREAVYEIQPSGRSIELAEESEQC